MQPLVFEYLSLNHHNDFFEVLLTKQMGLILLEERNTGVLKTVTPHGLNRIDCWANVETLARFYVFFEGRVFT